MVIVRKHIGEELFFQILNKFEGAIVRRCNKLTLTLTLNPKTKLTLERDTNPTKPY